MIKKLAILLFIACLSCVFVISLSYAKDKDKGQNKDRPPGWDQGEKKGWQSDIPPGQDKKEVKRKGKRNKSKSEQEETENAAGVTTDKVGKSAEKEDHGGTSKTKKTPLKGQTVE